jgi:heterodisulfide reductase subunit D
MLLVIRFKVSRALRSLEDSGASVVITTCPACTRSLRDKSRELGITSNIKVYHIVEWLYELMREGKLPKLELNETITYHDPCELSRHMKIFKEPREIIKNIQGLKLVEMRGNQLESNCCGGGGLYQVVHMDRALKIASLRLKDIPNGVKVLVSACPSCKMTLETAVRNEGLDVEVLDIVDLLMRAKKV